MAMQKKKISRKRRKCRLNHSDSNGFKRQLLVNPEEVINFTTFLSKTCPFTSDVSDSDMAGFDMLPATK